MLFQSYQVTWGLAAKSPAKGGLRFYTILSAKGREDARRPCGDFFYHEEHEGTRSLAAEGIYH